MQSKKLPSDFSNYIQSITVTAIDVEARKQFESSFALHELKKNQFLVKEDQICPYFCYLESGILQHSINVDDQEKTTYLALRNTFTSSLFSFLFQTPSRKSIKAIFDCKLWVLDLKTFEELKEKNEVFRQFYYNLIEKQICLIDDYRIDLLTLTPEERYNKLILTEPHLIKQVPLHYLASFLGISSRHMSRIRKNIN
ncbi:MAG: Crp/Fnr family transcriptional regulator [Flavobacterium sp.]|nr:Crp/Fnr family transcriptional regulator [Flavobacterium sp.]